MENEFIPYTESLALKELGFDEPCFVYEYTGDTGNNVNHTIETSPSLAKNHNKDSLCVSKPTWKQAFRWFREKYNLDVTFRKIDYGPKNQFTGYYFSIYKGNELIDIHGADKKCKLYEEAELECLKKLIEIVKEK